MNLVIETLNVWADHVLRFAWPMLWQSSLLIALLLALELVLRRKVRAAVRYALWLLVLVKLLLPPSLAFPTSAGWWLRPANAAPTRPRPTSVMVTYGPPEDFPLPAVVTSVFVEPPRPHLSSAAWLLLGMGTVSLGFFAWMMTRWHRVARGARRAAAAPSWLNELLRELRWPVQPGRSCAVEVRTEKPQRLVEHRENGAEDSAQSDQLSSSDLQLAETCLPLRPSRLCGSKGRSSTARLRLRLTDHPQSPAVCGLFRPVILLPRSLAERLPPAQLRAVLLHELFHLRRGDVWVNCAQALLQIAYWWHPLLWLANARIRRMREEAVDDAVMLALKEDAETYAPTLLEVAKLALHRPLASLGLVGILESRNALRQRIQRLMEFRPPRKAGLTLASALGVLGFAALAVPMGQAPAPTTGAGSPPEQEVSISGPVQEGKLLYELGKFEEAKAKFTQAVQADPRDQAAKYLLEFVNRVIERQNNVRMKLSRIRLDTISFDGLPLRQVVGFLAEETKMRDPEKQGVNFFIFSAESKSASPEATPEPGTGLPSSAAYAGPENLSSLAITIKPPLVDNRLVDVLDAVVKVAGRPIRYSIAENGVVVLSASTSSEPPALYVRVFMVAPDALLDGLRTAMGLGATNGQEGIAPLLRNYLAKAGVDFGPPKAVFSDDRKGILRIRTTLEDLNIVDRAITVLSLAPPQLTAVPTVETDARTAGPGLAEPEVVTNSSRTDGSSKVASLDHIKASTLTHDGKLLYEMGKLDEAEAKLEEAIRKDPQNEAAWYYLQLVREARHKTTGGLKKVLPRSEEVLPRPQPYAQTNLIRTNQGRLAIVTKLDRIRFDRVSFDSLPLREVVRYLALEAQKRDPDKLGVNIMIESSNGVQAPPGASLDSLTGLPKAGTPAGPLDASTTPITINPPLTNVRLADVLDAIVRVAGQPIKHSIEEYAVVFSAKTGQESPPLYTRTFKVDPNTLLAGLGSAKGLASTNGPGGIVPALLDYFASIGVDLKPPKTLFVKERQGMLLVRATLQDLDIIERNIAVLNTAPPQVNIKVKFVEVSQDDTKAYGFDWYLGNVLTNNTAIGGQARTDPFNVDSPAAANPLGAFPGNSSGPTTVAPNSTNPLATSGLHNPSPSPFTLTGILTDPQYRVVIKALQQRSGTELLAQPEVTMSSDRQAQMKAMDIKTVVLGINKRALTPPGITTTNGDESSLYVTEKMELGPVLDVIPSVLGDGYTIELMVIPTLNEFLGYEEDRTNRVAVYVNGEKKWVTPSLPKFRVRQMNTSVRVRDGQTIVLGGLLSETVNTLKDQVPMLGDLPLVGRFFRSESKNAQKRNLLVFITPTIIDSAGNRVHSADEMPFSRDGIPPQPPR
jgi:general secretion pathway protein D